MTLDYKSLLARKTLNGVPLSQAHLVDGAYTHKNADVHRPALMRLVSDWFRASWGRCHALSASLAHLQLFLAVEPMCGSPRHRTPRGRAGLTSRPSTYRRITYQ